MMMMKMMIMAIFYRGTGTKCTANKNSTNAKQDDDAGINNNNLDDGTQATAAATVATTPTTLTPLMYATSDGIDRWNQPMDQMIVTQNSDDAAMTRCQRR
jgi:hypothetical protein